jgi:hypothetical protein
MKKYLFGFIKKNGERVTVKSNSIQHMFRVRQNVIKDKNIIISPIINTHKKRDLPLIIDSALIKEVKEHG